MNVLLIEDEVRISSFIERGLRAEGFGVLVAGDGETGYALAVSEDVDLVVLDLMLPRLSGEEVLERLRGVRPELPVIVLTARDAVEGRVRNLNRGATTTSPSRSASLSCSRGSRPGCAPRTSATPRTWRSEGSDSTCVAAPRDSATSR